MLQTKGLVVVLQDAQSVALAKKARTDEDTHVTLDLWCLTRVTVWPEMPGPYPASPLFFSPSRRVPARTTELNASLKCRALFDVYHRVRDCQRRASAALGLRAPTQSIGSLSPLSAWSHPLLFQSCSVGLIDALQHVKAEAAHGAPSDSCRLAHVPGMVRVAYEKS